LDYPDEQFLYYICAKQFGWTINEFNEQPAYMTHWLIAMAQLEIEVENERQSASG
jgi:hypothetical protein